METRCTSGNREMILRVLQSEIGAPVVFHPSPDFACSVGGYTLLRDGRLAAEEDAGGVFPLLASMGLCDHPCALESPDSGAIFYPAEGWDGRRLMNLFGILSSRQQLLNRALAGNKAFFVLPSLMDDLLAHPPLTADEFLQALYGRAQEYGGLRVDRAGVEWTGFRRCRPEEAAIHRQLADRMMEAARTLNWVKPYTRNVRNKKYAFRTWLNMIGMIGPEYEPARRAMLDRLYGQSSQRSIKRRGGAA